MMNSNRGFFRERFPELKGDSFDCGICYLVCRDPKECVKCGAMFCKCCIEDWASKKNECPIGCPDARANVQSITGALAKIYRNLDIQCKYQKCGKTVKLCEIEQHELSCQLPQCEFFEVCGNYLKLNSKTAGGVCSEICTLMKTIKEANGNMKLIYDSIKQFMQAPKTRIAEPSYNITVTGPQLTKFKWDSEKIGRHVQLTNNQRTVFLQENCYVFRSVIGDQGLMGGVHYWEIHADKRGENELKVGVTLNKDFNCDTCFSDYKFGFAYYGLGQLRNGSNSSGRSYGKKFRSDGVLGVCLNMNRGTLSFALNGEYLGEAFNCEALKKGPIYPAISLLHLAGCTVETGKPVPSYFIKG